MLKIAFFVWAEGLYHESENSPSCMPSSFYKPLIQCNITDAMAKHMCECGFLALKREIAPAKKSRYMVFVCRNVSHHFDGSKLDQS